MSLKRYAIIAAVSYHNNHQQQQHNNTTAVSTTTISSSSTTTAIATGKAAILSSLSSAAESPSTITTAKTSLFSTASGYGVTYSSGNTNNNYNGSSALPGYYGGLSLFHQQNIRSGSGSHGNSGSTYPNAINSNVNLLLGGAMLSLVTTILCVVCYCCHRSIRKRTEAAYRQQRQWLETDPNMEIYSVEQCYETSGLFMGESTDGLSTVPTLHHEPPPSYDAVVLMQEQQLLYQQQQQQILQQQQQQQYTQRTSPPPGYRSSLDVSAMVAAATTAAAATTTAVYVAAEGLRYNNNNSSSNSTSNSCDNINNDNQNNVMSASRYDFTKSNASSSKANPAANPILNIKKVWNAQSCCSLQRAEVENMWNAAAAAVAARAIHVENTQQSMTSLMGIKSRPSYALAATVSRTTTPAGTTTSPSVNERFGRRYLKQSYRRGCPLCGKFRYDADDESPTFSIESDLEQSFVMHSNNNNNKMHETQFTVVADDNNNNNLNKNDRHDSATRQQQSEESVLTTSKNEAGDAAAFDDDNDNECSCTLSSTANVVAPKLAPTTNDDIDDVDDENGNVYDGVGELVECYAAAAELATFYRAADEADAADDVANVSSRPVIMRNLNADNNVIEVNSIETDNLAATTHTAESNCAAVTTASSTSTNTMTATSCDAAVGVSTQSEPIELVNLDSINENGIVRVDMSKIIDRTGLPTYEAALKLDSSGYV